MIGDTAQLAVEIAYKSQIAAKVPRDEAVLKSLNRAVGSTGQAFSAVAGHIGGFQRNIGRAVSNLGRGVSTAAANIERLAFAGGALAVGGGIAALKWAGDFEAQLRTINTIARETPEGLSKIGNAIRQIARDTGTPLEELTQGYYDLLSAGVKAAEAPRVLAEANKLAIGGLASAAEGVDLLTTAINVYGGDASKASLYTDQFAKAVERGKVTVAEIAASYAQVAPLARSLNIENVELAAGYARLTAAGTPAAEASTQMASALTALLKKTPDLEKLEKQTGKNYAALAGSKGLTAALEEMRIDADKAGIGVEQLVGRKEALLYILQTTGPNLKAFNADLAAMGDSAGTAAEQMAERQQGLNFQLARLKAGIKDAGITIGTALIPKLVPLIEKLNDFLNKNQDRIRQFGSDLAKAFEQAAAFASRIDFGQIGDSLKVAATFGKALIQAFLSAPQWLQTAVVTGWGLNKLTGGAVQNIMADLTKAIVGGALSQFVVRGSSPANPLFVSDVSGGLGGDLISGRNGLVSKLALAITAIVPVIALKESGAIDQLVDNINSAIFGKKTADAIATQRQYETGTPGVLFGGKGVGAFEPGGIFGPKIPVLPVVDMSPEARQARSDLHKLAQAALEEHRRGERGESTLMSIGSALTSMQSQLHADLLSAIGVLKTSNDPIAIALAVEQALAAVKGGAGSAATTQGILGNLTTQLAAAEASGNAELAAKIKSAIAEIEPFRKGRQWQQEQLAEARKIAASNKNTADKVAALKGIQQDLLSHQRTMAGDIVQHLIDVQNQIKLMKLPAGYTPKVNEQTGFVIPGGTPLPKPKVPGAVPSVNPSTGFVINANVAVSTRDVNSAQNIKTRYGPTPTQAGAA